MHQPENWGIQFNWISGQQPSLAPLTPLAKGAVINADAHHLTMNPAVRGLPGEEFQEALKPFFASSNYTNIYFRIPLPEGVEMNDYEKISQIVHPMEYMANFKGLDGRLIKSVFTLTMFEYYNELFRLCAATAAGNNFELGVEVAVDDRGEYGTEYDSCFFSCTLDI